jgi:2-haloacid dehalogenase
MNPPIDHSIQALVFDAYGTLFDPHSVHAACERFFPGSGAELSRVWRTKQLEYTWLRSLMNRYEDFGLITDEALQFACRSLQLISTAEQRQQLMQQYLQLAAYSDVREALAALGGVRSLILSNGSPQMLGPLVQNAGLAKCFSELLSVDAVKIYKPSPLVYQLAVDATGLDKKAIGFVSSNSWDIAGAAAFGFQTFWINRSGTTPDQLGAKPGAILSTLAELPALCNIES